MPRRPSVLSRLHTSIKRTPLIIVLGLPILALFALIGLFALQATRADTIVEHVEAESGTAAGNYKSITDQAASGGNAIQFGTNDPPLPFASVTAPIKSRTTSWCLDVENGVASPNSQIRLWHCNNSLAQAWTTAFMPDGMVELRAYGMCLGSISTGGNIVEHLYLQLQTCDNSYKQRWLPSRDGSEVFSPYVSDFNKKRACMSTIDDTAELGRRTVAAICYDAPGQKWDFDDTTAYGLREPVKFASATTKCLDLPSGNTADGTQLQIWDCNGLSPQNLVIGTDDRSGTGRVRLSIMQHCLTVKDNNTTDGTPVVISACTESRAQDWLFARSTAANGKAFNLKHMKSGKCLDTTDSQIANNKKMVIRTCDTNAKGQQLL